MFSSIIYDFWILTFIYAFTPCPATIYVAGQTLAYGSKAGWTAVIGMHLGCYVHILWAAASLSLILSLAPALYNALHIAGGGYLIWIGFSMLWRVLETPITGSQVLQTQASGSLLQSVWVEALNPQSALFYITQLPRYVDVKASHPMLNLIVLGVLVNIVFSSSDVIAMICARMVRHGLRERAALLRKVQLGGGSILVGLGMHILLPAS